MSFNVEHGGTYNRLSRQQLLSCLLGFRTIISKSVPSFVRGAIKPVFEEVMSRCIPRPEDSDLDWALHPGGTAILDGVQEPLALTNEQLQASREVYRTKGNSSSPTVLIVLDRLRAGKRGGCVVASSFGPGLAIELALLRRC
jgi:type III polyketide synthase